MPARNQGGHGQKNRKPKVHRMQLNSATGQNDTAPTSIWGRGLIQFASDIAGTAGNVVTSLGQTEAEKKKAEAARRSAAAEQAKAGALAKSLPLAIGAVVVLVVVFFVLKRR